MRRPAILFDKSNGKSQHAVTTTAVEAETGSFSPNTQDELRLAEMGHKQVFDRHFGVFSLIGLASTITVSWTGLGAALVAEINAGGPCSAIYGFILCTIAQIFVGTTIAELVSAYPVEGGMFHWAASVVPKEWSAAFSFYAGWNSVVGWLFITGSTVLIVAQITEAFIIMFNPSVTLERWHVFVIYQGVNILTSAIVIWRNSILPKITKVAVVYEQCAWIIIIIVLCARAPKFNSAHFVFAEFVNNTGWSSDGIAFITGLVNPLFAITGFDGISHIAEEIPNPSKNAPRGIFAAIGFAFISGFCFLLAIFFTLQDLDTVANSPTGLPLAELFRQAVGGTAGGFVLLFMVWMAILPTLISCQLAMSRITWAFARDNALPFSPFFMHISPRFRTPLRAQLLCTIIIAAIGCIYLGSSVAFASLLASSVNLVNLSYLPSFLGLVLTGRKYLHKGHFQLSRPLGLFVNGLASLWAVFQVVFFSFPFSMPVTAQNMNYNCVVIFGVLLFEVLWYAYKRKDFSAPMVRRAHELTGYAEPAEPVKAQGL